VKDLSSLAEGSLAVSSMAGGNMMSSNHLAQTAPGSRPVDPLPDRTSQGDPAVDIGPPRAVGDDGRPEPGTSYSPSPLTWKGLD
jgi:hypothetical protein